MESPLRKSSEKNAAVRLKFRDFFQFIGSEFEGTGEFSVLMVLFEKGI
jgi:hypothetical protein